MIFDTTFIIDLLRHDKGALQKLQQIPDSHEHKITTITLFELFTGILKSKKTDKEQSNVLDIIRNQTILPLDADAAMMGGKINGSLMKKGRPIDPEDCMIAGIALTRNEKVLTRNIKDFSRIHTLEIETY